MGFLTVVLFTVCCIQAGLSKTTTTEDPHGGVAMGPSKYCDDGETNIKNDLPENLIDIVTCPGDKRIKRSVNYPVPECIDTKDMPPPHHICINDTIEYTDFPPRGGPHRPTWPTYGEYYYLPQERWVHSLEHGAIVFLYAPCTDDADINLIRQLAGECLRRYIITPYVYPEAEHVPPITLMSWGCRLRLSSMAGQHYQAAKNFIKTRALKGPEAEPRDGDYEYLLRMPSQTVSDFDDTKLCDNSPQ